MSATSIALSPHGIRLFGAGNDEPAASDSVQANWEIHPPSAATNHGVIMIQPVEAPSVVRIPVGFNLGFRRTLRSIDALLSEPEEDDEYGPARPTDFAYGLATSLMRRAASLLTSFPTGSACTDGVAGIRLTWRRQTREIRLILAPTPEGRSYLYAQAGDQYRLVENITDDTVAAWLRWLAPGSE